MVVPQASDVAAVRRGIKVARGWPGTSVPACGPMASLYIMAALGW